MMKKIAIFLLVVAALNGCASVGEVPISNSGEKHKVMAGRKYMSCDVGYYQKGHDGSGPVYGPIYEIVANKAFIYALMASNSYDDAAQFIIPGWNRIRRYESGKGFGADIWENEEKTDVVIAFRGTNFLQPSDWIFGNFNVFWKGQYKESEEIVEKISSEFRGKKITATGHSLGGGLALHSSLYLGGVDAVVINASPRIFKSVEYENNKNYRLVLSENGEVLNMLRKRWPSLRKVNFDGPYDDFNFLSDFSVIEHGSYYIARGLTAVAASTGNDLAIGVMKKNLGCSFQI
jgi:hypothetical protein